jgi:large subunit ribosomal protein L21
MYAILSHGGRQYRVSAGDRLLVDRLAAEVGTVVALEPVLLTGGTGEKTTHGEDLDGMRVAATVVAHRRGKKLRIFKYKAKKRSRKMAGYRSDLTELRVDSILAKGAALPKASAGNGAPAPPADVHAHEKSEKKAASTRTTRAKAVVEKPAAAVTEPTAKTVAPEPKAAKKAAPAAKPTTSARVTRAVPKAAGPRKAATQNKESGDGT